MKALRAIGSRLRAADGVTLSEVLVVLVILLVILAGMTTLFISASNSQVDQTNRVRGQQDARLALDALRREVHCASAVTGTPPTAAISLTLGPYCPNGGTTLTSALTIPVGGLSSATIAVGDTSAFAAPSVTTPAKLYVGTSGGMIKCTGRTATSFTGCSEGLASSHPAGTKVGVETTVTWCTKDKNGAFPPAAASSPYSLWRYRGGGCSGSGRKWADLLTETTAAPAVAAGQVFVSYPAVASGELRVLQIALPVDATPGDPKQRFTLRDDIVLRNSKRLP